MASEERGRKIAKLTEVSDTNCSCQKH